MLNKLYEVFACARAAESCKLYVNKHEAKCTIRKVHFASCLFTYNLQLSAARAQAKISYSYFIHYCYFIHSNHLFYW